MRISDCSSDVCSSDLDLSAKLDALTASPGTSKTQILTDALNAWLERKGATELDQRFGPRLDRQTRTTERLERKVDALTEMLGLVIRHQLTLVADQPPFDSDPARTGRTRYVSFMRLVEQRLMRTDSGETKTLAPGAEHTCATTERKNTE